jgi:hypothetical protein
MPSGPLEKMEFERMRFPVPEEITTPPRTAF